MPRKVDSHWGEDGYEKDWQPVTLDDVEAAVIAEMIGIDPASSKAYELRSAVVDIGNIYRRWKDRGAGKFTRAQARQALEELLAADRIDYPALNALNERAFQCVHDSLVMVSPPPVGPDDSVIVALSEDRIAEATLRHAVNDAIAWLKAKKGPERMGDLAWAVAELCCLYEEVTERRATHSTKGEHMGYVQEPRSQAGQFVCRCFRSIDNKVLAVKIGRAMRYAIRGRR